MSLTSSSFICCLHLSLSLLPLTWIIIFYFFFQLPELNNTLRRINMQPSQKTKNPAQVPPLCACPSSSCFFSPFGIRPPFYCLRLFSSVSILFAFSLTAWDSVLVSFRAPLFTLGRLSFPCAKPVFFPSCTFHSRRPLPAVHTPVPCHRSQRLRVGSSMAHLMTVINSPSPRS